MRNTASLRLTPLLAFALACTSLAPVHAGTGDGYVRAGASHVDPKSDNGDLAGGALAADIDGDTQLGLTFGYFLAEHWALDLLAASSFKHTVSLNGAEAADFKHLPPTLGVQYHFLPQGTVDPFLGLGVNYTWTFDEDGKGPLAGTDIGIDNSWGLAAQAGVAFRVNERWDVAADARWLDIDADVKVNGTNVGEVNVDPLVYSVMVGYRF